MMPPVFTSIEQWLEAVPTLFSPAVANGLSGTFHFDLAGARPFSIAVTSTTVRVERGPCARPTMVVTGSADSWLDAMNTNDRTRIWDAADAKQLVLQPHDPALLKWFALAFSIDRTGAEDEYRKLLVGSVESWPKLQAMWIPFLREQGLQPTHDLLDLGCGTLRIGAPLIEYLEPGRFVGVDIREEVFPEARKELAERGLTHKRAELVYCPDLRDLALGRTFDVVLAGSVVVHLEDDVLAVFLDAVRRHLAPTGAFYANANVRDYMEDCNEQLHWLGFPWISRSLAFYRDVGRAHGLELADLGHPSCDAWAMQQQRMIRYTKLP